VTRIGDDPGDAMARFADNCAMLAGFEPAG
jgi:hypothetical protein